jgi:small subunit ribosomal protein S17
VTAKETGLRGKVRDGKVVSDKMQKTIVVAIEANFRHRLYKKTVRRVRRFLAHDERDEAKLGDRVRIVEASPISRRKRWRLLEVLTRADLPEVAPGSIDLELLGEVKTEEPAVEEAAAVSPAPEERAPAPAKAVPSPKAETVVPEEIEVAEEVPEVEEAAPQVEDAPEAKELATAEDQPAKEELPVEEEEPAQPEQAPAEAAAPEEEAAQEDETGEKPL